MMLGADSEFVNKFFQARKYWDINVGQWVAQGATSTPVSVTELPSLAGLRADTEELASAN